MSDTVITDHMIALEDEATELRANLQACVNQLAENTAIMDVARDRIERLEAALKPFAMNVDAVSLSKALGHITREHLRDARAALAGSQDK